MNDAAILLRLMPLAFACSEIGLEQGKVDADEGGVRKALVLEFASLMISVCP